MNEVLTDTNRQKKYLSILFKKLMVIRYDLLTKKSCVLDRDYFLIAEPNDEKSRLTSFKMVDLASEFHNEVESFCKTYHLKYTRKDKKYIFYNKDE